MRERIESKHVTKEIKSQMPVISPEIIKERGCTFCPYYLGSYEKQPRCMMKNCAWDDENERFHPILRRLIPFYKEDVVLVETIAISRSFLKVIRSLLLYRWTVLSDVWEANVCLPYISLKPV